MLGGLLVLLAVVVGDAEAEVGVEVVGFEAEGGGEGGGGFAVLLQLPSNVQAVADLGWSWVAC
jgi:hypothetical protein